MKRLLLSSIVLIVCCTAMRANIIFTLGNNPQPGEMNILLNSGGTGTLVMGKPNGDPSVIVDFASFQELLNVAQRPHFTIEQEPSEEGTASCPFRILTNPECKTGRRRKNGQQTEKQSSDYQR